MGWSNLIQALIGRIKRFARHGVHSGLTRDHVIWAYKLFLDREPESESVIQGKLNAWRTVRDLRGEFISSPEFRLNNPQVCAEDGGNTFARAALSLGRPASAAADFDVQCDQEKFLTLTQRSPGRGHFETMRASETEWELSGWILHPDRPSTLIRARLDGRPVGEMPPEWRADVAPCLPAIAHGGLSGFRVKVPRRAGRARLEVSCHQADETLTEIKTTIDSGFIDLPTPPPDLMRRVTGSSEADFFLADGARSYTDFVDALAGYRELASLSRMLDWGCGCGRLSRLFLRAHPNLEIHGCDIDTEAVDWCCGNIGGGHFRAVDPMPPTTYDDGAFDLVIGYSVLSHLMPDAQFAWLAEIRRLLAPGGLFLASIHGIFASRFVFGTFEPDGSRCPFQRQAPPAELIARGFLDGGDDLALDGIAPVGYYHGVFQTPEWTRRHWSKFFRILDIREAGMQNYQDLVIMVR